MLFKTMIGVLIFLLGMYAGAFVQEKVDKTSIHYLMGEISNLKRQIKYKETEKCK